MPRTFPQKSTFCTKLRRKRKTKKNNRTLNQRVLPKTQQKQAIFLHKKTRNLIFSVSFNQNHKKSQKVLAQNTYESFRPSEKHNVVGKQSKQEAKTAKIYMKVSKN